MIFFFAHSYNQLKINENFFLKNKNALHIYGNFESNSNFEYKLTFIP